MKKTVTLKLLCAFVALVLLLGLSSCGKPDAALVYKGENGKTAALSKPFFSLWMSIQKSTYSYLATDESAWDKTFTLSGESKTLSELVKEQSVESAKKLLAGVYLFDNVYRMKLTNEMKDDITKQVSDLMTENKFTTKNQLNEYLSKFGADEATLKEYFTDISKYDLLYKYAVGDGKLVKATVEEEKDYFEQNYTIISHIFFNTGTVSKSDGTVIAMTDEQRTAQQKKADEVLLKAQAGEKFDELRVLYTEDAYGETLYPMGFYVTKDDTYTAEFQNAAFDMKENEIRKVESTSNKNAVGIHIMKKLPMDKDLYKTYPDIEEKIKTNVLAEKFDTFIKKQTKHVTADDTVISVFDIKKVVAFLSSENASGNESGNESTVLK